MRVQHILGSSNLSVQAMSGKPRRYARGMHTFLCVDLVLKVQVNTSNDDVGDNVQNADSKEYLRIIERYLFGYLHHTKYDYQVRSTANPAVSSDRPAGSRRGMTSADVLTFAG